MPTLHIFIADDQIPPSKLTEQEFRERFFSQYTENARNTLFFEQCIFMGKIVQGLRAFGYRVTEATTHADAMTEISRGEFDLAIIDLGWALDTSIPKEERMSAGWLLCDHLDQKDEKNGKRTPQILFSSRFPTEPELSQQAAKRQKLPIFKEATDTVRNSLMAAVGFVDATLAMERSASTTRSEHFAHELQNIALSHFKEPLREYRRWTFLTLIFVAISLALLVAGVALAYADALQVATLSSVTSLVSGTISALLYKRLNSAQSAVENAQREVLKQLEGSQIR